MATGPSAGAAGPAPAAGLPPAAPGLSGGAERPPALVTALSGPGAGVGSGFGGRYRRSGSRPRDRTDDYAFHETAPLAGARKRPKRKRVQQACLRCRNRKQRCSGTLPCLSCEEAEAPCHFAKPDHVPTPSSRTSTPTSSPASSPGAERFRKLQKYTSDLRLLLGLPSELLPGSQRPLSHEETSLVGYFAPFTNQVQPMVDAEELSRLLHVTPSRSEACAGAASIAALAWGALIANRQLGRSDAYYREARRRLANGLALPPTTWTVYACILLANYADAVVDDEAAATGLRKLALSAAQGLPQRTQLVDFVVAQAGSVASPATEAPEHAPEPAAFLGSTLGMALAFLPLAGRVITATPRLEAGILRKGLLDDVAAALSKYPTHAPVRVATLAARARLQQRTNPASATTYAVQAWEEARPMLDPRFLSPTLARILHGIATVLRQTPAGHPIVSTIAQYLSTCVGFVPGLLALAQSLQPSPPPYSLYPGMLHLMGPGASGGMPHAMPPMSGSGSGAGAGAGMGAYAPGVAAAAAAVAGPVSGGVATLATGAGALAAAALHQLTPGIPAAPTPSVPNGGTATSLVVGVARSGAPADVGAGSAPHNGTRLPSDGIGGASATPAPAASSASAETVAAS